MHQRALLFSKYESTGNDFIFIDEAKNPDFLPTPELIQQLCHRNKGIGGDGLILVRESPLFSIRIFNADGSEASSCGNALLSYGQYLLDSNHQKGRYEIHLQKERVILDCLDEVALYFNPPQKVHLHQKIFFEGFLFEIHLVDTGVPHAVYFTQNMPDIHLAKEIRRRFDVNVNFVSIDKRISVATFERGVEGFTKGCGTGAYAVAFVISLIQKAQSPIKLFFEGGLLTIFFTFKNHGIQSPKLVGSPGQVFTGETLLPSRLTRNNLTT